MFRIVASLAVVLIIALTWFLFGNHGDDSGQTRQDQSVTTQPQPSADDDALRKSLGQ